MHCFLIIKQTQGLGVQVSWKVLAQQMVVLGSMLSTEHTPHNKQTSTLPKKKPGLSIHTHEGQCTTYEKAQLK